MEETYKRFLVVVFCVIEDAQTINFGVFLLKMRQKAGLCASGETLNSVISYGHEEMVS